MTVTLTVADSYANAKAGTEVADALVGGGSGIDLGLVTNNSYAPLTDKTANTGAYDIYLAHDAVDNPITSLKAYIDDYELSTGFTHHGTGGRTSAQEYTAIKNLGVNSGSSKNNADGLSGGLWMHMNAQTADGNTAFFDQANFPLQVKIFGDGTIPTPSQGIDATSAFDIIGAAMISDGANTAATTPVDGEIGKDGDLVLGDAARLRFRIFLPDAYAEGGYFQVGIVFLYSFTS